MTPLNYNHLYYFYRVAIDGGVTAASQILHLTPQTVSGQITSFEKYLGYPLFRRQGKKMVLTRHGQTVFNYAEDIFHLGDELRAVLQQPELSERLNIAIGVVDVIPKTLAHALIKPVMNLDEPVRLSCREGELEHLLAELSLNKLDLVLSDRPLPPGPTLRAYNHPLIETDISLFAVGDVYAQYHPLFPNIGGAPMLMPSRQTMLSQLLLSWFDQTGIRPITVAEFDDSALAKAFCQAGMGLLAAPSVITRELKQQYGLHSLGVLNGLRAHFFAISPYKKVKHPGVVAILNQFQNPPSE